MEPSELFSYYRFRGFPYYRSDKLYRDRCFELFNLYDVDSLLGSLLGVKRLYQSKSGLNLLNSYIPEHFGFSVPGYLSCLDVYESDDLFGRFIYSFYNSVLSRGRFFTDSEFRSLIKIYNGVRLSYHRSPLHLYLLFRDYVYYYGDLLDIDCGLGGNLLGSIRLGVNYFGICEDLVLRGRLLDLVRDYGNLSCDYFLHSSLSDIRLGHLFDFIVFTPLDYYYRVGGCVSIGIDYVSYVSSTLGCIYGYLRTTGKVLLWFRRTVDMGLFGDLRRFLRYHGFHIEDMYYVQSYGGNSSVRIDKDFDRVYILSRRVV